MSHIAAVLRGASFAALGASILLACGGDAGPKGEMPTADTLESVPAESLFDMGREFAKRGDSMRAAQYMSIAFDRGYDPPRVSSALIGVYVSSSRYRDAIEVAERRLGQDPYDWRLRVVLATLYLSVRDGTKAYEHATRAVAQSPQDPRAQYLVAILERDERKDLVKAREHFVRYLSLDASGAHALEARAFVESGAGDPSAAPEPEPEAMEIDPGAPPPQRVPSSSPGAPP